MTNIHYEIHRNLMVLVHGTQAPSEQEWQAYLSLWSRALPEIDGLMVYTLGPGPDTLTRQKIKKVLDRRPGFRISVLTQSSVARGIVTALRWLGDIDIRSYAPNDIAGALEHVGHRPEESAYFSELIRSWQARLMSIENEMDLR